jgi:hypothetical protein
MTRRPFSRSENAALATVAICLAMLAVTSLSMAVDDRILRGVTVWSKPAKFALSFGLHLATLLIFVRLLADPTRSGWAAAIALVSVSVATLIEVLYVALQSARGRESHFNIDTAFESFMYHQVMGGGSLVLVAGTGLVGVLVLRKASANVGEGVRLGAGWGAIVSAAATPVVGGVLASGALSGAGPWIGEPRTNAGGLPLVGRSRRTGDLRVPHFAATHLIQALALSGLLADRLRLPPRLAVGAAAVAGLALTIATFVQAVTGLPLVPASILAAATP